MPNSGASRAPDESGQMYANMAEDASGFAYMAAYHHQQHHQHQHQHHQRQQQQQQLQQQQQQQQQHNNNNHHHHAYQQYYNQQTGANHELSHQMHIIHQTQELHHRSDSARSLSAHNNQEHNHHQHHQQLYTNQLALGQQHAAINPNQHQHQHPFQHHISQDNSQRFLDHFQQQQHQHLHHNQQQQHLTHSQHLSHQLASTSATTVAAAATATTIHHHLEQQSRVELLASDDQLEPQLEPLAELDLQANVDTDTNGTTNTNASTIAEPSASRTGANSDSRARKSQRRQALAGKNRSIHEAATYKDADIEHTSTKITVTNQETGRQVTLTNLELTSYTVRQLNKMVAGFPRPTISKLKQRRRTLKNRGYAQNCRHKRLESKKELERQNEELRAENRRQACELDELRASMQAYEDELGSLKRQLHQQQQQQQQHSQQHAHHAHPQNQNQTDSKLRGKTGCGLLLASGEAAPTANGQSYLNNGSSYCQPQKRAIG